MRAIGPMSRQTLPIFFVLLWSLANAACGGSSGQPTPVVVSVTFAAPAPPTFMAMGANATLAVTTNDARGVKWSCTTAGAAPCSSANFSSPQTRNLGTTVFTAPETAETVMISATSVTDPTANASAAITVHGPAHNFVFYASGEDIFTDEFSIAGVVSILDTASADGSFAVVGGEQDLNDGDPDVGDNLADSLIIGGSLGPVVNGTQTLSLQTNSVFVGAQGAETFVLAFSNPNHALITEVNVAHASGSFDLQTATTPPTTGSFSFVGNGHDLAGGAIAAGGVFTIGANAAVTGILDFNDAGSPPSRNNVLSGSFGTPDSLGRGTATNILGVDTFYYVVGPKVIRLIDMDENDTAVGSAYSQGANPSFSNASIGQSVFSVGSSLGLYAAVGQFAVGPGAAAKSRSNAVVAEGVAPVTNTFTGVGDLNESVNSFGPLLPAQLFGGTYNLASSGYGTLSFTPGSFGDVATIGVYAVDPTLNILDPNNTCCGGGALLAEMDSTLLGTGLLLPQTDITVASFSGSYAFGGQGDVPQGEFDFLGSATATRSNADVTFSGSGVYNGATGITFSGTAAPDGGNPGRYVLNPLTLTSSDAQAQVFPINQVVAAYQASGSQLLWVEVDNGSFFFGSLQQVPGPGADAKKAEPNIQRHH
jgi:hypothetical protein